MARVSRHDVHEGDQLFAEDGGEEFGAVREVCPDGKDELVIYVENGGEERVPLDAVRSVHDGKVMLDLARVGHRVRELVRHAHDRERPGM